jgi:hypothetical protein
MAGTCCKIFAGACFSMSAAAAAADGTSSGLLLLNSNGMEVTLEPVKLTYR